MFLIYFSYLLIFLSFFIFLKFYKHILMILISMEFLVISFIFLFLNMMMVVSEEIYLLYFLIFSVCDSVIGLSLVIMLSRNYGNEKMKILNFKVW